MSIASIQNIVCILYFTTQAVESVDLRCYRNSIKEYMNVPLEKSSVLVNTSYIKLNQELDIVIHGYSTGIDDFIENIIESLIKISGDTKSYCALDWRKEANADIGDFTKPIRKLLGVQFLGLDYFIVSALAGHVGHSLGEALIKMVELGLKAEAVYLIGHSEGSHLAGAAGRVSRASGHLIGRITGLDPAKPTIEKRLDKNCAKLVDAVHTNPKLYGTCLPVGHIDFWLNEGCPVQPGCKEKPSLLSPFSLCSHVRALLVMAEAIEHPDSFEGRRANSYKHFLEMTSPPGETDINFIGFKVIPSNNGSFYLNTNAKPLYGKGREGMDPAKLSCE